jgi:type IV secretion system protein VirD4
VILWGLGACFIGLESGIWFAEETEITVWSWAIGVLGVGLTSLFVASNILKDMDRSPGRSGAHGDASFASEKGVKQRGLLGETGRVCGRTEDKGRMIRFDEKGHLITIAPTRSGKGVGAVIPNALTHRGSLVVIDPKGENTYVTRRWRREIGQKVYVLDPNQVTPRHTGERTAQYNPMDFIRRGTPYAVEDADLVAEMLAETQGTATASSSHFEENARMLIRTVVLYVAERAGPKRRHLGEVMRLLTQPPEAFEQMLEEMSRLDVAGGSVARGANAVRSMSERERSSVLSTTRRHLDWLEGAQVREFLSRSDFSLSELKDGNTTVYLVLEPGQLKRYRRLLRLFVGLSLSALQRDAHVAPEASTLFLLDEIAQLGYLSPLEQAVGVAAGYGIVLWQFWQDMGQIRSIYGERGESFISNSAVFQVFGVSDQRTAEYVSRSLGQKTVETFRESQSVSRRKNSFSSNENWSVGETGRALLRPEEVRQLGDNEQLLLVRESGPIKARKLRYWEEPEFDGRWDPNPLYNQD